MITESELVGYAQRAKEANDLKPLYKVIDDLIGHGSPELVARLLHHYHSLRFPPHAWIYERLMDMLPSTARTEMATVLLDHLISADLPIRAVRREADMLVGGQPRTQILNWLEDYAANAQALPMLGLLLHSALLQYGHPLTHPAELAVQHALVESNLPLGLLPLYLHEFEINLPRRHYSYQAGELGFESTEALGGEWRGYPDVPDIFESLAIIPAHQEYASPSALTAPFVNWVEESNAMLETKAFEFVAPVVKISPALLCQLDLASTSSVTALRFVPCTAREVFRSLFTGGANGGAYGGALCAATARLAAWQSLAALVGLEFTGNADAVAQTANQCQFAFYFDPESDFFYDVFDFAVACLHPDGLELVILAVTDTD